MDRAGCQDVRQMQVQMGCRFIAQAAELEDLFLNGSLLVAECDERFRSAAALLQLNAS